MLMLRIRQAETALNDGRLDEAFELLRASELREHQRGQRLIGCLARAFAERGNEHLQAGRLAQALADCNKADNLAGKTPWIAGLGANIAQAMQRQQRSQRTREQAVAQAREHFDQGRLSMGENLLEDNGVGHSRAAPLLQDATRRREAAAGAAERVDQAMQRQDWHNAVNELCQARQWHGCDRRIAELSYGLAGELLDRGRGAINEGRLDRAVGLLALLTKLADRAMDVQELQQVLGQCRQAQEHVENGRLREARDVLRRLASLAPQASWLAAARESAEQAVQAWEHLGAGPLALLASAGPARSDGCEAGEAESPVRAEADKPLQSGGLDEMIPLRFLIQIDGVGSYPVFRDSTVTIGPVSSARECDLGLIAGPDTPVATIQRSDEDYFVGSDVPIKVNDRRLTGKLLTDGDRIVLSNRCEVKFRRPSAASNSAVLTLPAGRLARADIKDAVLMDREIIIGAGPSAHIRAKLPEPIVLFLRNGRLLCGSGRSARANGNEMAYSSPLGLDRPVKIEGLSFVLVRF